MDNVKRAQTGSFNKSIFKTGKDYLLGSYWLQILFMTEYVYNGVLNGNNLVAGKTNCGKTTFVQKLGINDIYGKLLKIELISYIQLSKNGEAEIQTCFSCPVQPSLSSKFGRLRWDY